MQRHALASLASLSLVLTACGGGGSGTGSTTIAGIGSTAGSPTPTASNGCSLRERQDWVATQLRANYLFPETLPSSLDPTPFATVGDYLDALTATARAQGRDRGFTFLTSIRDENAFFASGSSAGFGIRLSIDPQTNRVLIAEAFEGAPALAAGIDRGTEIVAIGTSAGDLKPVGQIIADDGPGGVSNALGPSTAGTKRLLRISDAAGTRNVLVAKADYDITPVSARYGVRVIDDGGTRVGYVNLRTFISTADPALRDAIGQLRQQGVTNVVVDLRYNGGGLVSIAELAANLLGGNRQTADVQSYTVFRPELASRNSTAFFAPQPQSVSATKLAFIGTGGTASASELLINAFVPYLHANDALIGSNTFGKPVGQIAVDRAQCDDRLRVVAFKTENAARQGDYFGGLAGTVEASCQAPDDLARQLGDPAEESLRQAIDFIQGRACTPISVGKTTTASRAGRTRPELLEATRPSAVQRQVPGLF